MGAVGVAAATAREKVSTRNVEVGVYLTDGAELYEVRRLGDIRGVRVGEMVIPAIGRVRLVNCRADLPYSLRAELRQGAWVPFEEVLNFEVVVAARKIDGNGGC